MKAHIPTAPKSKRERDIKEAYEDGMQFGLSVVTVALNEVYGFGYGRLCRLEQEVSRLLQEEFEDSELGANRLSRRIEQIRGGRNSHDRP